MAEVKPEIETAAKIKVIGVGGGGGSALTRMIKENLRGVDFVAVNTDIQALQQNPAQTKISIGKTVTRGLGAGMNPDVGKKAAEESANDVRNAINGADMVFLTGGLGGGTGSGALPEIAKIAKDAGSLTVAVVTKPFIFEGAQRRRIAEEAFARLSDHVDTIITIPNDRVLQIIDKNTSMIDAFKIVDDVLRQGVQGIADVITIPGMINVDFADVKAIIENAGSALMGIGVASGENRAVEAAKMAIASPLLELSIDGAKGILFTIAGGSNLGMYEVSEAAKIITGSADEDAKVIFGAHIDETLGDEVRITVIATGFDGRERRKAPSLAGDTQIMPQNSWNANQGKSEDRYSNNFGNRNTQASNAPFGKKSIRDTRHEEEYEERPVKTVDTNAGIFGKRRVQDSEMDNSRRVEVGDRSEDRYVDDGDDDQDDYVQQKSKPQSAPQNRFSKQEQQSNDDDDLGIPAFIRRKMM
jgi:cell division protein FtsZ